jgi:hypothetical protein
MGGEGSRERASGRHDEPDIARVIGLDAESPAHLDEAHEVRRRHADRGGGRSPFDAEGRREDDREARDQGDGQRVVEEVETCVAGHDEDKAHASGRHVDHLPEQKDAERPFPDLEARREGVEDVPRGDEEHDQERDRRRQRPARAALEQLVEPLPLTARMQVGDEGREDEAERGEEEEQHL